MISFEDFQKATGYQRGERVDYYTSDSKDMVITESSGQESSESFKSVDSIDPGLIANQMNLRFEVEFKQGDMNPVPTVEDSDEYENEILSGVPQQMDCLIDNDIDESVVI